MLNESSCNSASKMVTGNSLPLVSARKMAQMNAKVEEMPKQSMGMASVPGPKLVITGARKLPNRLAKVQEPMAVFLTFVGKSSNTFKHDKTCVSSIISWARPHSPASRKDYSLECCFVLQDFQKNWDGHTDVTSESSDDCG